MDKRIGFISEVIFIFIEVGFKLANIPPDTLFVKQDSLYTLNPEYTKRYGISGGIVPYQHFKTFKDIHTYRIFCLGSSTVLGFPYTANVSFPALLGHRLTSLQPGQNFEVINCGITGATGASMLTLTREITSNYQPDLIIVYCDNNEKYGLDGFNSDYRSSIFSFSNFYKFWRNRLSRTPVIHTPFDYFSNINNKYNPVDANVESPSENRQIDHFLDNLKQIITITKANKINLLLCTPVSCHADDLSGTSTQQDNYLPSPGLRPGWLETSSGFNAMVKSAATNENIPVVDMDHSFDEVPFSDTFFYNKTFITLQFNLQLSGEICKVISENNWLGKQIQWQYDKSDSAYLAECHLTSLDHETANYTLFRVFLNHNAQSTDSSALYQRIGTERTEALAIAYLDSANKQLSDLHLDLGWEYASNNKFDMALQEFYAAMIIKPSARAYAYIGNIYTRKSKFDYRNRKNYQDANDHYIAADHYFAEGLRQFPDNSELNFFRAVNYSSRQDKTDKALACFQKALAKDPTNEKIIYYLGELYMRLKDYKAARRHFTRAIQLYPKRAEFHVNLALTYVAENNLSEAEQILNHALTIRPNHPRLIFYLNQIKARLLIENKKKNKGGDSS